MWDSAAEELVRIVNLQSVGQRPVIELEHFCVQPLPKTDWNGTSLTTINIIKSVTSVDARVVTQVRMCSAPQSPYNLPSTKFVVPHSPAALHQYQNLKSQALPFRGTFIGTLTDVEDIDYTSNGQPKRAFNLIDDFGYWFPCCAIGRNATEWRFPQNAKVVIYFGSARLQSQQDSFILYIFRDGLIVAIAQSSSSPTKRIDVSKRQEK